MTTPGGFCNWYKHLNKITLNAHDILTRYLHTPSLDFFSITFPFSAAIHFWLKAVLPK